MHVRASHLVKPELVNHSAEVSHEIDSMEVHEVHEQVTLSSRIHITYSAFEEAKREVLPHQSLPVQLLLHDVGLWLVGHVQGARESCVSNLRQVEWTHPWAHLCHSLVATLIAVILSH